MATIRERKGKKGTTFQVQVRVKGSPLQTATFKRKTDAKAWAQKTEAALREGHVLPSSENRRRTVGEMIDRFVAGELQQRASARPAEIQLRWWERHLGRETKLVSVTPAQINEGKDKLASGDSISGKPLSQATIRKFYGVLSRAFSLAVQDWFWLEPHQNPFLKTKRPTDPRGRVRFLSDDERDRLFAACRASKDHRLYPLVVTAIASGARRGELLGLRWSDIDSERGLAILENTKNGERRSVPISQQAMAQLHELGKIRHLASDLVFACSTGGSYFPQKEWKRIVKEAELEDFTFHDLRHTAASYLAMSGATLAEIAEILGHKTLQMVKRYAHLTDQHSHRVATRMADRYLAGA